MKITISGHPGAGKSTIGQMLSEEYNIPFFSVGDLRGEFAKRRGMTIDELNSLGKEDSRTDIDADEYQKRWAEEIDSFILDGRLSYYIIPQTIRVFLEVAPEIGAQRIFSNPRGDEKRCETVEKQIRMNLERCVSDRERYSKIYGIEDCYNEDNFDIVIDTTTKNPQEVFSLIKKKIIDYNQKMNPKKFYLAHSTESRKEIRVWEQGFEERTGIQLLNPFFDCGIDGTEGGKAGKEKYPIMGKEVTSLYEGCLNQIARKDVLGGVIIVDDNWTWGAPAEQATLWLLSRLIYTISLKKDSDYNNHPVLKKYSNRTFANMDSFEGWMQENKENFFRDLEKTRRERMHDPIYSLLVKEITKNQRYLGK